MISVYTVSIFLITYLICSISPSIEICKKVTGEDIRNLGSGNAGSTNATSVMGR
jgi:glycerol-3-phosphate acyltransferase PlsY